MNHKHNCKHIKREGESCKLNNGCKFPNCSDENRNKMNTYTININNLCVSN